MFSRCTSLTQAPALPAITLSNGCYQDMFKSCTSLTQVPALPATTLANNCYNSMFYNCTSLKLSSTQTEEYTQEYRIPSSGTGTTATDALIRMFINTGGTFAGAPEINTTYYLSTDNMIVRDTEIATLNGYVGSMIDDASIQSDWNQNDETQPDYVKNRPFYAGDPVETVLVEESTVSFTNVHGSIYMGQIQSNFEATVGATYKVSWDGVSYESTCVDSSGSTIIGNLSIMGAGPDTGEPFLISVFNGDGIEIYTLDTSASHTFSISGSVQEVVKIDEKYLPEYSVFYSGDPADWTLAKKKRMYNDFISGKLVLYEYSSGDSVGVVLSAFYSTSVGLNFVFFDGSNYLRRFVGNAISDPLDLSDYGINSLIKDKIDSFTSWSLYKPSGSEVAGDLLSMRVAFDSTTKKACIFTDTKTDIGSKGEKSTIVTNGDSDIVLSSSTAGSTKKFRITVDDSGTISATEIM